ncbi:MAG: hypothetical protein E7314_04985 [Clostridiales bacterium]|nr:hypothetical protein [Clostridiales bacterium]
MEQFDGRVAESWQPTFENVTREFINDALPKILFNVDLPNFRFDFRENKAIEFIEQTLINYTGKYQPEKVQKIMDAIKSKCDGNEIAPVMVVNDYKKFFEYLRMIYEKHIELHFQRSDMSFFPRWEKENLFELIWLRATPDDFNNPEEFLRKQSEMICDKTFDKFNNETFLGEVKFLDDNVLCIKNGIGRTWDENSREMEFIIYDKYYYEKKELICRPRYKLPLIRYGIYKKNGKKVCYIGSIQSKTDDYSKTDLQKQIDRKKYKANEGVAREGIEQVEPKCILALSLFVNLLHKEGITDIEIPGLYVLDYEYHEKRSKRLLKEFNAKWTEEKKEKHPDWYKEELFYLNRSCGKEDLISEIKSERLIAIVRRLMYHYPNVDIKSYPGDVDSFMHMNAPVIRDKKQISGSVFQELYSLIETKSMDR